MLRLRRKGYDLCSVPYMSTNAGAVGTSGTAVTPNSDHSEHAAEIAAAEHRHLDEDMRCGWRNQWNFGLRLVT